MNKDQFKKYIDSLGVILYSTGNIFWAQFITNYSFVIFDKGDVEHHKYLPNELKQILSALGQDGDPKVIKDVLKDMPDYWVDGWTIVFNPNFMIKCNSSEDVYRKIFHEGLHDMLMHMERSSGRETEHWDVASDMVVESTINNEVSLYCGYTSSVKNTMGSSDTDIYWELMDEFPPEDNEPDPEDAEENNGEDQTQDGENDDNDDNNDDNDDRDEDADENEVESNSSSSNSEVGNNKTKPKPVEGTSNNHDWNRSKSKEEKEESGEEGKGKPSKSDGVGKAMMEAASAAKASNAQGSVPGFVSEFLEELLAPKTDLVTWVSDLVSDKNQDRYSMTKINAGLLYCSGVATSSRIEDVQEFNMLIYLDTSGSVSREALTQMFSEIYQLVIELPLFSMTVIMGDVGFEEGTASVFEMDQDTIDEKKFLTAVGRGGTDLDPIIDYIKSPAFSEKVYDCIIVETDLYISEQEVNGLAECQNISPICMLLPTSHDKEFAKKFDMCFPLND